MGWKEREREREEDYRYTVSENRIRGEQVTGGRDPVGRGRRSQGEESFLLFNPRVARVPRRAARRYTYTLGVYILYPVYPSCR